MEALFDIVDSADDVYLVACFETRICPALDREEAYLTVSKSLFRRAIDAGTNLYTIQNGRETVELFPEALQAIKTRGLHNN